MTFVIEPLNYRLIAGVFGTASKNRVSMQEGSKISIS